MSSERCEDCENASVAAEVHMKNWLHCALRAPYIYLSAPLAVCEFEPSRFVAKKKLDGA